MIKSSLSRLQSYSPYTTALFTAAFIFCVAACNTLYSKENYLKNYELFVTQTEQNYTNYTNQDWENSDLEYNKFTSELYQKVYSQLTSEDQHQIGKLKTRYETIKLKIEINNSIQSIKDGVEQTSGALEELVGGR